MTATSCQLNEMIIPPSSSAKAGDPVAAARSRKAERRRTGSTVPDAGFSVCFPSRGFGDVLPEVIQLFAAAWA
jgi:hypothetical protein